MSAWLLLRLNLDGAGLLGGKMPNELTLTDATAKLFVAGNVQRPLLGVVLLGLGPAVQIVGNLAVPLRLGH